MPFLRSLVDGRVNKAKDSLTQPYLGYIQTNKKQDSHDESTEATSKTYAAAISTDRQNTEQNTDIIDNFTKSVSTKIDNLELGGLTIAPSHSNTINALKDQFSCLERDFIEFKLEVEDNINSASYDDSTIQDKLKRLDNHQKTNFSAINGMIHEQTQQNENLQTEFDSIKKSCSILKEHKGSFSKQIKALKSENHSLRKEHESMKTELSNLKELVVSTMNNNRDKEIELDSSSDSEEEESSVRPY